MNEQAITETRIGIVNVLDTGTAFAATGDGNGVYIPQAVAGAAGIRIGDEVVARLVRNLRDPNGRTPYMAVFIEPRNGMDEAVRKSTTDDIFDMLKDGYMTTHEIAEELGMQSGEMSPILNNLHTSGRLVKAAVFAKPGQQRASLLLWALDVSAFTGE